MTKKLNSIFKVQKSLWLHKKLLYAPFEVKVKQKDQ